MWPDDLCFLVFTNSLATFWAIVFETCQKKFSKNQFIKFFDVNKVWDVQTVTEMQATLDALYSERNILRKVQSESAHMNERAEKVVNLRKEPTNSVPCGHESAIVAGRCKGGNTCLNHQ